MAACKADRGESLHYRRRASLNSCSKNGHHRRFIPAALDGRVEHQEHGSRQQDLCAMHRAKFVLVVLRFGGLQIGANLRKGEGRKIST